jgi:hypothetical protein
VRDGCTVKEMKGGERFRQHFRIGADSNPVS